ncbi:MAG: type II toxin-antitoxin system RelE/ParE family toxin [Deltaproteobacteria bacterium]|nr:type II toxin-antitoxin system RelE/ParE family toxin [Deltaproteobacteria bacterium]
MKGKPVIPRALAVRDVDDAVAYYAGEGAEQAALGFVDALAKAYAHLSRHPASGITRFALLLELPGLRSWPVSRFPYLVFYVERADHIDVWRVLHGGRDVAAWMQEPGEP